MECEPGYTAVLARPGEGLSGAVSRVVVCVVSLVMANVLGFGKRRRSEHHHQQGSGDDFLHGFDCSTEMDPKGAYGCGTQEAEST